MDLAQHCDQNGLPEAQTEGKKKTFTGFWSVLAEGNLSPFTHRVMAADLQVIFQPFLSFSERKRTSSNVFI